ncbi:MAG: right-handed parallel beta-helix repeat-containing protein [Lentisphaeraceae bacterium]|nr:right-handed parallel beta-helix repeat-containing protein [Lentisphaeraceae bacterium]
MKIVLSLCLLFLASCKSSNYLSISPSDMSLKQAQEQIRSLKQAGHYPKEGITIEIEEGDYFLDSPIRLSHIDSGIKNAPVKYKVLNPTETNFYAGTQLPKFEVYKDGLWRTKANWKFQQLFINDKRAVRARTPNKSFFKMAGVKEEKSTMKGTTHKQSITLDAETTKSLPTKLGAAQIIILHKWDNTRRLIHETKENRLVTYGGRMKPWNNWKKGIRFYFENYFEALDNPGEWFQDEDGWVYYKPKAGQSIDDTVAFAPSSEKFLVIEGNEKTKEFVEYVELDGFNFAYSAAGIPATGFEPAQAAFPIDAAVQIDYARHISISNSSIRHYGRYALWMKDGCSDITIDKCLIEDGGAGGIRIGPSNRGKVKDRTQNITVNNSIIRDAGHIFPCAVGLWIGQSPNNKITHNDIGNLFYSAISVGWTWGYGPSYAQNNLIEYNHLHNIGKGLLSDMGAVYTLGNGKGTRIQKNIIHDVNSYSYGGWGLYTDEGSTEVNMSQNLVYRTKSGGFHQHYGKNNIISHNILHDNLIQQVQATRAEKHQSFEFKNNIVSFDKGKLLHGHWEKVKADLDKNVYWSTNEKGFDFKGKNLRDWQAFGHDENSIIEDPNFVDAANDNFNLKPSSPALKLGFRPFDHSKVGVYGSENWIEKAKKFKPTPLFP